MSRSLADTYQEIIEEYKQLGVTRAIQGLERLADNPDGYRDSDEKEPKPNWAAPAKPASP